ncbi:MAG TPA: NAD(P)H-dependent glycerol-3-phosphate dehydrogenase [Longimicrobiales bacterium]|nr:NAD(P)H-dependent glycerol-3-phosphate dehydrogenase [Longimicrobiales bacterium]
MSETIAVLGAGSWGTALASLLADKGHDVTVWSYETDVADAINESHENPRYLRGIPLAPALRASAQLERCVRDVPVIVSVSPAQHVRRVLTQVAPVMLPDALVVSASKGIEMKSLKTMAQVAVEVLPRPAAASACYISGPSFALEVAKGLATAVTIASHDAAAAVRAQEIFQTSYFRVYTSEDVTGVELGGSLKNVIAIAAGMAVGLGLGHNATAALITRGLAEMMRLGVALGANPLTLSGLAGMGDLILTCTGDLSRNRHVGTELGKGRALADVLAEMTMIAEGVDTTRAAYALAQREGIEMPIVSEVHAVLFEEQPAREALDRLMLREPKPELWR